MYKIMLSRRLMLPNTPNIFALFFILTKATYAKIVVEKRVLNIYRKTYLSTVIYPTSYDELFIHNSLTG